MHPEDKAAIDLMIEARALEQIVPTLLPNKGWGITFCPDGDVAPWALNQYLQMLQNGHGRDPCTNWLPVFGGPAACAPKSPFSDMTYRGRMVGPASGFVLSLVEGMLAVKNKNELRIAHMAYMPHCSCGMCNAHGVRVWTNFLRTIEWKMFMRDEFPNEFTNHKVFPWIDYYGYDEHNSYPDGIAFFMMHRGNFERLAQRRNWA